MQSIKGVNFKTNNGLAIFYVEDFSCDFEDVIRDKLSSICHGYNDSLTGYLIYSYKETLKEFIKRYEGRDDTWQKGMIGELLVHILLLVYMPNYKISSPFFNLEERSQKKGFDLILKDINKDELWIVEVKSGNKHKSTSSTGTAINLINKAKVDLSGRLNENNLALWINAINGAKKVYGESLDSKESILKILNDKGDKVCKNSLESQDINVILAGALFHNLDEKIEINTLGKQKNRIDHQKLFKRTSIIAIQKKTFEKIYNFLKKESLK